jgi:hypothetical protein
MSGKKMMQVTQRRQNHIFWIFVVFYYFWFFFLKFIKNWIKNWIATFTMGFVFWLQGPSYKRFDPY